jgi:hypothetical protein
MTKRSSRTVMAERSEKATKHLCGACSCTWTTPKACAAGWLLEHDPLDAVMSEWVCQLPALGAAAGLLRAGVRLLDDGCELVAAWSWLVRAVFRKGMRLTDTDTPAVEEGVHALVYTPLAAADYQQLQGNHR